MPGRFFVLGKYLGKTASDCVIVGRYARTRTISHYDSHMTIPTQPERDAKVRASGVAYPDLERKINWHDEDDHSVADVWSRSSGAVCLVVERKGAGWQWQIFGWLGVQLTIGRHAHSRDAGKKAAVRWWGTMTVADRARMEP